MPSNAAMTTVRRLSCAALLLAIAPMSTWRAAAAPDATAAPPPIAAAAPPATANSPVERGRYLARAANCVSCHTVPGGQVFAGGRAFRTPYGFFGALYSSNITPDRDTGIGAWTEADFLRAMRTGIARNGEHLFPAFPYTAFTRLASTDISDIYAYLRTVPAVRSTPPANSFWFRQRWAMALWNWLYFAPGERSADAQQPAEWHRGRYLAEALGHCGACHSPRNWALAEDAGAAYTGGEHLDEVESGKQRLWSAPNLTGARSGLARWSVDELGEYFKTGHNRWAGTLGPMNEVIANSLQHLDETDRRALAVYIKSLAARGDGPALQLSAAEGAAGKAVYDQYCNRCHLASGRGGFRKAPPVAGSLIVQAPSPASLLNVILYGAQPAADLPPSLHTWEEMPGYKDKLGDAQVSQLANFLRASWDNRGGRVAPGDVAAQR